MIFLKIVLVIIVFIVLVVAGGIFYITRGLDSGSKLAVNAVNLTVLSDGIYNGSHQAGRWSNEVNVTVKDHKITDIAIVKDVTFSNPDGRDKVFKSVIEKQNTNVDVVSGATVTTKAYLKSIEDALKK